MKNVRGGKGYFPKKPTVQSCPSGIEENGVSNSLSVFPNPTNGELNISFSITGTSLVTVNILNVQGQVIYSQQKDAVTDIYSTTIDLSNLSKGVYWLNILSASERAINKIVIE